MLCEWSYPDIRHWAVDTDGHIVHTVQLLDSGWFRPGWDIAGSHLGKRKTQARGRRCAVTCKTWHFAAGNMAQA